MSDNSSKRNYTEDEVVEIVEVYSKLATIVGNARGLGVGMLSPSLNTLEVLLEIKERAYKIIPEEIREKTPEIFDELNGKISYCERNNFKGLGEHTLDMFEAMKEVPLPPGLEED
tara:strand:- start:1891 stop:2235 length:345 start_codon:yes stop_codon:yes gene_type:complete